MTDKYEAAVALVNATKTALDAGIKHLDQSGRFLETPEEIFSVDNQALDEHRA